MDTGTGDDVAQEGKLGDASVLYLDVTEAVESLLVGAIEQAEGNEEAERGLGSELGLEGVEGRGSLGRGGGGKGSGRSRKGGKGDTLKKKSLYRRSSRHIFCRHNYSRSTIGALNLQFNLIILNNTSSYRQNSSRHPC